MFFIILNFTYNCCPKRLIYRLHITVLSLKCNEVPAYTVRPSIGFEIFLGCIVLELPLQSPLLPQVYTNGSPMQYYCHYHCSSTAAVAAYAAVTAADAIAAASAAADAAAGGLFGRRMQPSEMKRC